MSDAHADDERTDEDVQDEPQEQPAEEAAPQEEPLNEPEEPEEPEYEPEEPMEGPESDAGAPPDTDVFDMLRAAIGLFAQEAWIALGLQPRYGAAETRLDLRCAKVAIDTAQMLVEQLGEQADEVEKREFERTLTDLRVNFMRRKAKAEEGQSS